MADGTDADPELQTWLREELQNTLDRERNKKLAARIDVKSDCVFVSKKIKLSQYIQLYLNLSMKFEAAVKNILIGGKEDSLVATQYSLNLETLRKEIRECRHSAEMYEYNGIKGILSIKDAILLLEILVTIPRSYCRCKICTLERLPALAYEMVRQKYLTYPTEWGIHQKAGKDWVAKFQMEYYYEIRHSFPLKCKKFNPNVASSSTHH